MPMMIFKNPALEHIKEDIKAFTFPHQNDFLEVSCHNKEILSAFIKSSDQFGEGSQNHFYSTDTQFNILPVLSEELVDSKALQNFLDWNSNQKVFRNINPTYNIETQFQVSPVHYSAITRRFPSAFFHHYSELLLSIKNPKDVTILQYDDNLLLMVKLDGQLKLMNTYKVKTPDEILYYTLLVYQELGLSVEEHELFCFIDSFKGQNIPDLFKLYIRRVMNANFAVEDKHYLGILSLIKEIL